MQKLIINQELTDLNSYIAAERTIRYAAADLKKAETALVAWACKAQRLKKMARLEELQIDWYTRDLRKDADNVAFALKFIMDGLVVAGVLPNDSRKYTGSIVHHFYVDRKAPRVEVELR